MNIEEALAILDQTIQPDRLNDLQELVFQDCWRGKTYQQIAHERGYDHDYIRVIGSQLWQLLSDRLKIKISKNNFRSILRQYAHQDRYISQTKTKGSTTPAVLARETREPEYDLNLEIPIGPVSLDSPLYIQRPPIEEQCYQEIIKPGALILLKAPSNLGKTSLKNRILAHAANHNYKVVRLNFEQADRAIFGDLNQFLRWFCANISRQLKLECKLDQYWDEDLGRKLSCTIYLESYILEQINTPFVVALDEVNLLFEYPQISQNFLPLLRSWYEEAKDVEIWQKLRLVVVYSTEVYVPLNINQSPFNVGLSFRLSEFTPAQVEDLAQRHGLNCQNELELAGRLRSIVGGNPYLLRMAMYHLKTKQISFNQLTETAPTLSGIYSNHLRHHWANLQKFPELMNAMRKVVSSAQNVQIEPILAYKLESMGLVKLEGDYVKPSCELYRLYFRNQLANSE